MMRIVSVWMAFALAQAGTGQTETQTQQSPSSFDVASVKHNSTSSGRTTFRVSPGGRLTVENMPLRLLIQRAYGIRAFQIVPERPGLMSWIEKERYDVAAKVDGPVPEKQVAGLMLQKLLEDRFRLKLRRETREMPVFHLIQTAAGKVTASKLADCRNAGPEPARADFQPLPCHEVVWSLSASGIRLRGEQITTKQFAVTLATVLGRAVVDETTADGWFDLDLGVSTDGLDGLQDALGGRSSAMQGDESASPSVFTALPRLGLKLVPGKGPVEVWIIEQVERPSGN